MSRLDIFVSRSFAHEDDVVWEGVQKTLKSLKNLDITFEDAGAGEPRPISEKVKRLIDKNEVVLCILTRRYELRMEEGEPPQWTTSEWVIQESGYAIGLKKQTIFLIENGVHFPATTLAADREWISFDRENLDRSSHSLVEMLTHLIRETLPGADQTRSAPPQTDREMSGITPEVDNSVGETGGDEPTMGTRLLDIVDMVHSGEWQDADIKFSQLLTSAEPDVQSVLQSLYLPQRFYNGDSQALARLIGLASEKPEDSRLIEALAACYTFSEQYSKAAEVLEQFVHRQHGDSSALTCRAASARIKANQLDDARELLVGVVESSANSEERAAAFVELAELARVEGVREVQASCLEQAVELEPSNLNTRFALAYLYSELNKHALSLYHYLRYLRYRRDPWVINNTGVEYDRLSIKGKQVQFLSSVKDEYDLARVNVARVMIDAGLYKSAEDELTSLLQRSESEFHSDAVSALHSIVQQRSREDENEERVLKEAESERTFWLDNGTAYTRAFPDGLSISMQMQSVEVSLSVSKGVISGRGSGTLPEDFTWTLARRMSNPTTDTQPQQKERVVRVTGYAFGCALQVDIAVTDQNPGKYWPDEKRIKAWIVLDLSSRKAQMREEDQGSVSYTTCDIGTSFSPSLEDGSGTESGAVELSRTKPTPETYPG